MNLYPVGPPLTSAELAALELPFTVLRPTRLVSGWGRASIYSEEEWTLLRVSRGGHRVTVRRSAWAPGSRDPGDDPQVLLRPTDCRVIDDGWPDRREAGRKVRALLRLASGTAAATSRLDSEWPGLTPERLDELISALRVVVSPWVAP